jgi:hypothetical protein
MLDYNYDKPIPLFSAKDIVENIREVYSSSGYEEAIFTPVVKLKPGAVNDGRASSYFLDLVLEIYERGTDFIPDDREKVFYSPTKSDDKKKFKKKVSVLKLKYKRAEIKAAKLAKAKFRKKDKIKKRKK